MSADLLAEFGTPVTTPTPEGNPQSSVQPNSGSLFDDFESFGPVVSADSSSLDHHAPGTSTSIRRVQSTAPTKASDAAQTRSDEDPWRKDGGGTEVLFDVSTERALGENNDDDDWGDFEKAESVHDTQLLDTESAALAPATSHHPKVAPTSHEPSNASTLLDLLSLDDTVPPAPVKQSEATTRVKQSSKSGSAVTGNWGSAHQQQSRITSSSPDESFDDWGDFEDGFEETRQNVPEDQLDRRPPNQFIKSTSEPQSRKSDKPMENRSVEQDRALEPTVRPVNIPPPSVLLQLFPSLLDDFRDQGIKAKRDLGSIDSKLALNLTSTLKVAARIIAGRTLRWKRDIILSQSTKIGPARSGKASGMKLSSVSKGENVKEQQEVAGVIEVWRRHNTILNSIIQSVGERPVPVITDKFRIDTAGPEQGALKAGHACALCGLKRDERLPKIDESIEDSFGDWWSEHWGHTDCKWFWDENSRNLSQR